MFTIDQIRSTIFSKKYTWFSGNKDYNVNIIGIRNLNPGKRVTNVFDDWICVSYKLNGEWKFNIWPATTDPGTRAVRNFTNPKGVARLIPDQYRSSFNIRKHKNLYDAICQLLPVKVWRDKNKDMSFDEVSLEEGIFGINIHKSNPKTESDYVENWSEGCQVFKRAKDFDEFMKICKSAEKIHGSTFTYTLITTDDIKLSNPNIKI